MKRTTTPFENRYEAGRLLGHQLSAMGYDKKYLVLGLPRGGIPVAHEVASALGARLDVFVVRKLGLPGHEEFAIGAIAPGGVTVLNGEPIRQYGLSEAIIHQIADKELAELNRRLETYRLGKHEFALKGHDVLVVDDGLATGSTMKVACHAIKQHHPISLHVAVPVASPKTCRGLRSIADAVVCLRKPQNFAAVGQFYKDFSQTTDDDVMTLLEKERSRQAMRKPKKVKHEENERRASSI